MSKFVRGRQGLPLLRHPEGYMVAVDTTQPYDETDPLVKAFRWAFASDEELAEEAGRNAQVVTEVSIEQATKRPGERRNTKRS